MWPIATTVIKISTYITFKVWIIDYLKEYPIFIVMDLVAPILYLLLWIRIKESELGYVPEVSKQKIK